MYHKGKLTASSGAKSIEIFLEMTENSLLLLAQNPDIINQGANTQQVLDKFASRWKGTPVVGIARFDNSGSPIFLSSNIGVPSNLTLDDISVDDRDYFTWAEDATEDDTYIGKPLLPRIETLNTQFIIPLITPINRNGEFDGVLLVGISLPKLTAAYLDPLQVSQNSRVYLINSDGTILASLSGYEGYVGLNYIEYLNDNPHLKSEGVVQAFTKALENEEASRLELPLYSPSEKKMISFLIAYSPVIYGNEHWTIALAIPADDMNSDLAPFKKGGIMFIALFFVVILSMSAIGTLTVKIKRVIVSSKIKKENKN